MAAGASLFLSLSLDNYIIYNIYILYCVVASWKFQIKILFAQLARLATWSTLQQRINAIHLKITKLHEGIDGFGCGIEGLQLAW